MLNYTEQDREKLVSLQVNRHSGRCMVIGSQCI